LEVRGGLRHEAALDFLVGKEREQERKIGLRRKEKQSNE